MSAMMYLYCNPPDDISPIQSADYIVTDFFFTAMIHLYYNITYYNIYNIHYNSPDDISSIYSVIWIYFKSIFMHSVLYKFSKFVSIY